MEIVYFLKSSLSTFLLYKNLLFFYEKSYFLNIFLCLLYNIFSNIEILYLKEKLELHFINQNFSKVS